MSKDFLKVNRGVSIGNLTADPSDGVNGDIYYHTPSNRFRKFQNGAWSDLSPDVVPTPLNFVEFASVADGGAGNGTWEVPVGVTQIFILGIGGGAGGPAGGARVNGGGNDIGAGGGAGGRAAVAQLTRLAVTPGQILTINLGTGGNPGAGTSGTGGNPTGGTNTTVTGDNVNAVFPGAPAQTGGGGTSSAVQTGGPADTTGAVSAMFPPYYLIGSGTSKGGNGGSADGQNGTGGIHSLYGVGAPGGKGGPDVAGDRGGGGGGGGGAAGIGPNTGIGGHGDGGQGRLYETTAAVRSGNVVTLTMANTHNYINHNYTVGDVITVSGLTASFNGTFTIIAVPTNLSIQYAQVGADEVAADGAGNTTPGTAGHRGSKGGGGGGGGGRGAYESSAQNGIAGGPGGDGCVVIIY